MSTEAAHIPAKKLGRPKRFSDAVEAKIARRYYSDNEPSRALAAEYGVSETSIRDIAKRAAKREAASPSTENAAVPPTANGCHQDTTEPAA